VQVVCHNCGRTFILDATKVAKVQSARCLCSVTLDLRPTTFQQQRLGKYVLQRRIAAGGMGEIYYAKIAGVEGFEREVAIKKMLPHLTQDRDFVNMLVKEAKLTVLLHHPNIVQVYDLAKEGEEYYIAMEFVPGINLGNLLEHCREKQILPPVPVAVHIMLQALKGLAYAHDLKGADGQPMHVLHRDITPQNILVTQAGWVKITDFGIAKAKNEISTTSPGIIKGKLGYIAPEQLEGKEPDGRVDIFCAGIVSWELLAVRRLFKGTDEVDTFRMVAEAKVPPLSRVRQDVSAPIEAAIRGALTANRDERYRTAHDFYDALARSILPLTVDDCANAAKAFLGEQVELFNKVSENSPAEGDGPTMLLTGKASVDVTAREVTITDLMQPPEKPKGKLVGYMLAVLVSAARWRWRLRLAHGPVAGADAESTGGGPGPDCERGAAGGRRRAQRLARVHAAERLTSQEGRAGHGSTGGCLERRCGARRARRAALRAMGQGRDLRRAPASRHALSQPRAAVPRGDGYPTAGARAAGRGGCEEPRVAEADEPRRDRQHGPG
jgi:serine/threonine protein kinase